MKNVIFVVPYAMDATIRFVRAAANLPGIQLAVISQEPSAKLPEDVSRPLVAHDQIENCLDADQLTDAIRRLAGPLQGRVDAVIAILEQLQEPLAIARERLGIAGMGVQAAQNFREKSRMKDVLRAGGLPCARHALAHTHEEAWEFARDCGYPLVIKPPAGAGGKNTFRVDRDEHLEQCLRTLPPSASEPTLLEEFLTGQEHSFDAVQLNGELLFHSVSRYYPTPLEVMETPWIQWCVMLPREIGGDEYADVVEAGRRALQVLGMDTGLAHMEWFRRPDGSLAISEVAARPPGAQFTSLLSYAHDLDFYAAWTRLLAFGEFDPPERRYAAGAAYLRGQGQGRVTQIHGLERAQEELGELVVEAKLPKAGQHPSGSYEGEGYVIVRHPETQVVEDALRKLVSMIRVELRDAK